MKAKIFSLMALVLGMVSCQTEPEGLDVIVGGEVDTVITVNIPESETRANAGTNSAEGAFTNGVLGTESDNTTMRYIFQVYYNGETSDDKHHRQVAYSDGTSVSFPVRLIPGRDYRFVVWADVVADGKNDTDLHYNTDNLTNITLKGDWNAMDETRDAFTAYKDVVQFNGQQAINIDLYRPFAKLRVLTTDFDVLESYGVSAKYATVEYTTEHRVGFNAYTGEAAVASETKTHHFEIANYSTETNASRTIFSDYFFAENDVVSFNLYVYEDEDRTKLIKQIAFNTDINVKRNYLTTLKGNVLTEGNKVNIEVKPGLGGTDDPDYNYNVLTSGDELIAAIANGGSYKVGNNIYVADTRAALATRSAAGQTTTILNLNGYTITVENNTGEALVDLDGGVLIVEGKGAIESTAGALVKGDTYVTGEARVDAEVAVDENNQSAVKTGVEALAYVLKNGGTYVFTKDMTATETIVVEADDVVLDGNGFTLTTTATRAIRVTPSKANVTINDLNIVVATERVYPNDVRGISIDPGLNGVDLTLNNCSVDFTHKTGNDWSYAVNVSGNGTDNKVTVNGGTYNGANVVNAHGANNTIVVKNATLTSLYPNNDTYYGACIWVLQNQGSTVYAEGNTFNGDNAAAFNLGTGTALEEKDNIDNTMYYEDGTCYVGSSEKFQKAIAEGANNIVLGKGTFDLPSSLTQKEGTLTIKGRGNDVTVLNGAMNTNGNHPGNYANGVALEFEGLTFKTANNGYNGGFGHAVSVTFRESKIVGQFYAHSNAPHYFYDCTIDPLTGYLYTYGSDCVFEGCTFAASEGKALQIYEDAASGENTVTITNCAFVAAKQATTWDGKPVTGIDINSNGAKFEVYINNCTTTGFPTGLNSNSNLWNVKDAGKAHANVYVDGVQVWFAGYEYVADGLLYNGKEYVVISAKGLVALSAKTIKGGETVKLGADIDLAGVEFNGLNAFNPEPNNTFDGQGYTVSNWTYTGKADDMGFIRNWVGPIKNLTIKNAILRTGGRSAVIAAKPYGNIENCHVVDCNLQANYWACGLIAGMHNSGNMKNCSATNSYIKSTGGTAAITGVLNETNGVRTYENCSAVGCTINNGGDDPYAGAAIVGLINIDNVTVKFVNCTKSDNTYEGTAKDELYGYNAGDNTTVEIE